MQILDGKMASKTIFDEVFNETLNRKITGRKIPHLTVVLVGDDGASESYVNAKIRACNEVGFKSTLIRFDKFIREEKLLDEIDKLNNDDEVDGFIVQLPLPHQIDENKIILAIDPKKDVDGFHPVNIGKMVLNQPCFLPATPAGIITLFKKYKVETEGKHCVVIGRSHIVGLPISVLMGRNANPGNSTVTLAHSKTQNLKEITQCADIIIIAVGRPGFLTADMVKEGVVIVDVGITRVVDKTKKSGYSLKGDVDFENVAEKAKFITPVPGGIGPMTIVSLLKNTLEAARLKEL